MSWIDIQLRHSRRKRVLNSTCVRLRQLVVSVCVSVLLLLLLLLLLASYCSQLDRLEDTAAEAGGGGGTMGDDTEPSVGFHEMGLDDRILQAVARLKWPRPTLIQEKAIPLALEGKDLLARARTGSGKTGAFAIPCVQRILASKAEPGGGGGEVGAGGACVRALVLAPTRELCRQLCAVFVALTAYCSRQVRCLNVCATATQQQQQQSEEQDARQLLLLRAPDVLVATPARALALLRSGCLSWPGGSGSGGGSGALFTLVVDEADLMVSFGHGAELGELARQLPPLHQTLLLSATLSEHVHQLRQLLQLQRPVVLKLHEPQLPPRHQLQQYHIQIEEEDKFLLLYTLFKLKLIHGKTIIFVNKVDRCYRLKLFLEQFGVPSCALNSELPADCRCHIVSQFNDGTYDIIIASDERFLEPIGSSGGSGGGGGGGAADSRRRVDRESGVARGIDFQFVSNVLNFDFPADVDAYIHRAGRTARGSSEGAALSFVSVRERPLLQAVEDKLHEMFPAEPRHLLLRPFHARLGEMDGFRYRARDAMRAVTRRAIREARIKEIKQEMFNSQQLKGFFDSNPRDLQLLRHDKTLHTAKVQKHMKHVPEYIVPKSLRRRFAVGETKKRGKKLRVEDKATAAHDPAVHSQKRARVSSKDPLRTMEFSGLDEFV